MCEMVPALDVFLKKRFKHWVNNEVHLQLAEKLPQVAFRQPCIDFLELLRCQRRLMQPVRPKKQIDQLDFKALRGIRGTPKPREHFLSELDVVHPRQLTRTITCGG